jgi:phage tail-like protein
MNETPQKSAGLSHFGDIVLKRGQVLDEGQNDLYNWAQEVHDVASKGGSVRDYRRDVDIVQYERGGLEVIRWRVHESFPNRFKPVGDLNGLESNNSIEELTLVHEGFEKAP